jgi:3-hydroxyisobutyrate dehydrogenase-like beta-hydroxyacid dehydrogenase
MAQPTIGFIGLGEMGAPMVRNLLRAGFTVLGFDIDGDRVHELTQAGMAAAEDSVDVMNRCDLLATSLPSSDSWVEFMEGAALHSLRAGQVAIDFGTVVPTQSRRVAHLLAEKGVSLVDAPVSGGKQGAEAARLYVFVGGEIETVKRCMPILHAVAGQEHVTYCGPAGSGQVVKGVNQLMMGIVSAAYLEAISFGVNSGVPSAVIHQAIGNQGFLRGDFSRFAEAIVNGKGNDIGVKFRELPYFLEAARDCSFDLPITATVRALCERGDFIVVDDHRLAPSYWHELTNAAVISLEGGNSSR